MCVLPGRIKGAHFCTPQMLAPEARAEICLSASAEICPILQDQPLPIAPIYSLALKGSTS